MSIRIQWQCFLYRLVKFSLVCIVIIIYYSDINECDWGISGCSQKCFNTVGNYYCDCYNGYLLGSDNHTCIGNLKIKKLHGYYFIFIINIDKDECMTEANICDQLCINDPGTFQCACITGYFLKSNGITCTSMQ